MAYNTENRDESSSRLLSEERLQKNITLRVAAQINEGVSRLQEATDNGPRMNHQAIIELDHLLLSDFTTIKEQEGIVKQARSNDVLSISQGLYIPYETLLEEAFVRQILQSPNITNHLDGSNVTANYLNRYFNLAANEVRLAGINKDDKVLFLGSGPFPITAIEYARQTGCQVDCVEHYDEKAETSRKVIRQLGYEDQIRVHTAEGQSFDPSWHSVILVGVLAQPKQDIFNNLDANCKDGDSTRILARTTKGLRQFIYPPAKFQTTRFSFQGINTATHDQALSTILLR